MLHFFIAFMPFARVCGKMRWQFGGNLQPVRMICDFDWKECPSAIINYIWSEIVTDVVDCLTNEWMLWRMIAMLFVCALLVHTIYSKTRLMDETTINRENLNVVGCKVQDLELKVNILTYKMQYGTWPLPRQIRGTGIESGIRNVRLTLTNSNDRNTWLKHMLLSPSENTEFVPFAKIGPRSVRCLTKLINLETKYMASRFSREASPASNKVKSSSSEKSIKYEKISINSSDSIDNRVNEKFIPKSENLGLRHKDSTKSSTKDPNCWSETQVLKQYRKHPRTLLRKEYYNFTDAPNAKKSEGIFTPTENRENSVAILKYYTKNMTKKSSGEETRRDEEFNTSPADQVDSTLWSNYREHSKPSTRQQHFENETTKKIATSTRRSEEINGSPEERVQSTHETLHQVKEKLENLHSVLRICGSNASASKTQEEVSSKKELAESILHDLKNLGNLPTESDSDGKTGGYVPELMDSNTDESQCPKEETDSASEFEQCRSDRDSSSARSYNETFNIHGSHVYERTNFYEKCVSENNFVSKDVEEEAIVCRETENSSETQPIPVTETLSIDLSSDEKTKFMQTCEEAIRPSSNSSQTELSKDSEAEDKTNATLLREALKFKRALLTQIEQENKEKTPVEEIEDSQERKSEESDGESDEPHWPNVKNYFQSKLLDIISEEQSASSSTEKTGRTFALPKISMDKEEPAENLNEISNDNSDKSELVLVAESSEYFSLSNLNEKLVAESIVNVKRYDAIESIDDFTENDPENEEENLHKNINDLVNQSVQNIREYIEAFSQLQNDAIAETKQAIIDDQPENFTSYLKDCSSEDSIMHFVNTVAKADSMCEQLPRKLSEPLINSLLDLESTESENESPDSSDYKPDFSLKRRPGSISLAEQNSNVQSNGLPSDNLDSRSLFESAHSEIPDEDQRETEVLSSEPSCKELLMDYSLESDSDFTDDKPFSTLNLIEFEEENEPKAKDEWDERARTIDSPLTGRTVIRATSSSASNIQADSTNESTDLNEKFERIQEPIEKCLVSETTHETSQQNVEPETNSIYFTDDVSISEMKEKSPVIFDDAVDDVSESNTWIIDNSASSMKADCEVIETTDSAISETPTDSTEMMKTMEKTSLENKRPGTGDTIVRKDILKEETPNTTGNLSSDTSGTYMDASSRDYLNSSGISLAFDGSVIDKSSKRIEITALSKSARGSNSSPLQQHIPWNTPKRGLSLNNASTTRSKKPEKCSKPEKLKDTVVSVDKNKNRKSKQTRSQSSSSKDIKSDGQNLNQFSTKDLESSSLTSTRRSGKNIKELPERRSRSYVTPRKSETSPRNSVTSQPMDSQRHSRISKDSDKSKINRDSGKFDKVNAILNDKVSSKSCITKTSSKSCIPILKSRLESVRQIRAKSPMRGPLTMSMSSWSQEARRTMPATPIENVPGEGNPEIGINEEISGIISPKEPYESLEKIDQQPDHSANRIPESRTVIYVNIVTEQEHSATRVVDPKKFLEYLKDRDLKIHSILDQEIGVETSLPSTAEPGACSSPRILTVVSSAVDGNVSSDRSVPPHSDNSALTGSWSLRVEQREIEVSAKPSVMDTSTSISDLPEISTETRANHDKFKIFEVPKELTKDEYIVLLEALNQDPNLHQLREMHKLCNKLGLGFHE